MVHAMKWFLSARFCWLFLLPRAVPTVPTPPLPAHPLHPLAPAGRSRVRLRSGSLRNPGDIGEIRKREPRWCKEEAEEETAAPSDPAASKSGEMPTKPADGSSADQEYLDYVEEEGEEEKVGIADPLEPFNRAMYHFNDKLYFWVLKPVAQGYRKVVPEVARVGVGNFFTNIAFPDPFRQLPAPGQLQRRRPRNWVVS